MSEGSASKLSELLEASRPELEAAVADARRELRELDEGRRELDERRQELVSLITRAQAALGEGEASYERQVENRENIRKGIADLVTVKRRMALRQEQLGERLADFDAQAREAMSAGREDLARAALERKQLAVQEAGSLDQQIAQLESEQEKLIESEKQLQAKIEQLRSKQDVINVQYFQRLTALGPGEDDVDRQLDQLGAKSAVDDEFARLKAEVQSGAPHAALLPDDAGTADHAEAQRPADGDGEAAPAG
jgi:phage shock protein A